MVFCPAIFKNSQNSFVLDETSIIEQRSQNMAKPNAYQLEQLKAKGRNPDFYNKVNQQSFDKVFPPAPPAGKKLSSTKAAPKPAIAAPAPEPARATPVVVPELKPKPIVPDTIIIPKALPADNRTVPGVYNLEDLKTAYIGSRSRDPLGAFEEKLERSYSNSRSYHESGSYPWW
jgi:hypothetical protein